MKHDHIGIDTDYHCINCGHHHCKICPTCHRCGCTDWKRTPNEPADKDKDFKKIRKELKERKRIKNRAKKKRYKENLRKRREKLNE